LGRKTFKPRDAASPLTASQANSYRHLVGGLPLGMAVLHLLDPADVATWQLVAINETASRIAGPSIAGLLNLPIVPRAKGKPPVNLANLCRHVVAKNCTKSAGRLSQETATGSRAFYAVSVFALAENCTGLLFQETTRLTETTRELIGTRWQIAQMCESAGSILWRAHPRTLEFTYVTPQAQQMLGYWIERWLHESNFWKNHVHPEDWNLVEDCCAKVAASGAKVHFECRMFSVQGSIRWFRVHVQRADLLSGRTELAGVMIDITDQKRTAEASRQLSMEILRAQEQERKTISRELHDSIGQHLTGLNYALGRLGRSRSGSEGMRETVRECLETVQLCMKEIRSVSYMLRPPLLDLLGLGPTLRSHAEKFSQENGIQVEVDVPQGTPCVEADAQMALFRIAQECLTNIQRHAQANAARVKLAYETDCVLLEVEDHGIGVDPDLIRKLETGTGAGVGLLKIRERVKDLNGKMDIEANSGGTVIRVKIPRPITLQTSKDGIEDGPSLPRQGLREDPGRFARLG